MRAGSRSCTSAPGLRPYASFGELAKRLREDNPRLTAERADFLARHWGRETGEGTVVLRGDPAHKIVNPVLYRYEEVRACWQQVRAPVLWVDGAEIDGAEAPAASTRRQYAERRAAFREPALRQRAQAGHMLHHDQPEAVAAADRGVPGGADGAVLRHPSRRIRSRGSCAARRTSCAAAA